MLKKSFYSHGKLLLTSEYLVLDGVKALALPTKKGQWLTVEENDSGHILWKSLDKDNNCWFETIIKLPLTISEVNSSNTPFLTDEEGIGISETLLEILKVAKDLNSDFLSYEKGYIVETRLEFNREWGLGSSSTLINNIAQWADVNAFTLLKESFGGSGYDIASAQHKTPIFYTRKEDKPIIDKAEFDPLFKNKLFFIYLNRKQDSKQSIKHYQSLPLKEFDDAARKIKEITNTLLNCSSLEEFCKLIDLHEQVISKIIKTPTVKSTLFSDYSGSIKSLGGWGGDFILATGTVSDIDYFLNKGYHTIIPYSEMVLY
ncbi:Mevalonate kinase [Aquimarina amphilecti]|uniref:Mevalonate kinase n=1 Tax=Aquimarina amphilecti TaxID=1038014 RepID=A0A1H7NJS6_AQUAM|nr:GYDIA family GHMP kinase [Aquimarina amphilecti]SEL23800.1 Mevalonate kinase [Aquimarina amphilecti]